MRVSWMIRWRGLNFICAFFVLGRGGSDRRVGFEVVNSPGSLVVCRTGATIPSCHQSLTRPIGWCPDAAVYNGAIFGGFLREEMERKKK